MSKPTWLGYFEGNARQDCVPAASLYAQVPAALRAPLAVSLGRFQLGESAGGRIHAEMPTHPDPALDAPTRRAVQLYIEEEWRHARELSAIIKALGGELQHAHWACYFSTTASSCDAQAPRTGIWCTAPGAS